VHCNLRQPDAAQSLSALISSPVPSLKSLSLSVAVLGRFCCWYVTLRCDLDLWPLTLNICSVPAMSWSNTVPKIWAKWSNPRRSYCNLNIWHYDFEHVSRVALCSGIVCTNFKLSEAICSWNVTIFDANTSLYAMTLTFDPSPWTCVIDPVLCYQTTVNYTYQIWARLINLRLSYWRFSNFSRGGGVLSNSTS